MKRNDIYEQSLSLHEQLKGKMSTELKAEINSYDDLALLYSPGVARPSEAIFADENLAYTYTGKGNTVAIVSDGSAVLGLGNIGPKAALPVMEGKAALFKRFAGLNAVPIVLDTQDPDEIIAIVKAIAPGFGGINLEDIAAPQCVYIEEKLEEALDIPVFHDDQHGTSIVTIAALINALRVVNKKAEDIKMVVSGAGAAGSAIISLAHQLGVQDIYAFNSSGLIMPNQNTSDPVLNRVSAITNKAHLTGDLETIIKGADVFIGVSVADVLTAEMVQSMAKDPIILAMANPNPEIDYDTAIKAGAKVVGTGRSDYPNQINNILVFPGLFKSLLKNKAHYVPEQVKLACAQGIADLISKEQLSSTHIVPSVFDDKLNDAIDQAVSLTIKQLREDGHDV
ncbi:MAG TPA: NADP-dependent malic enzyme [Erysipelothrix sp.]